MLKKDSRMWVSGIIFLLFTAIYLYVAFFCVGDINAHGAIAVQMLNEHRLLENNFLLYLLANLMTGFSGEVSRVVCSICVLLGIAAAFRYYFVDDYFRTKVSARDAKWLSISLLFVYIIPIPYILFHLKLMGFSWLYSGNYVPNLWHNSTILFCMPFVFLMYRYSLKQFENYSSKVNYALTIVTALCVLIKPSFFFIFIVGYGVMMLYTYGIGKKLYSALLPLFIGMILMGYEYLTIYGQASDGGSVYVDVACLGSKAFWISVGPSMLTSLLIPVSYVLLNLKTCMRDKAFWFLIIMLAAAFLVSFVCKEVGPRATHGNFGW